MEMEKSSLLFYNMLKQRTSHRFCLCLSQILEWEAVLLFVHSCCVRLALRGASYRATWNVSALCHCCAGRMTCLLNAAAMIWNEIDIFICLKRANTDLYKVMSAQTSSASVVFFVMELRKAKPEAESTVYSLQWPNWPLGPFGLKTLWVFCSGYFPQQSKEMVMDVSGH